MGPSEIEQLKIFACELLSMYDSILIIEEDLAVFFTKNFD